MAASIDAVRDHYQADIDDRDTLLARIAASLDAIDGPVTAARLAGFDQFHVGGLAATAALAERVGLSADASVLDAGSGLGGPSRFLAETTGCRVESVDLAPDYVAIAALLTERVGLTGRVHHRVGDLAHLPFADATFDLVWTQHVVMNIRDRDALYRELRRVLKAGGHFAFYDPIAADGPPEPFYPLPWAQAPATSTLLTADETRAALERSGLTVEIWDDATADALGWASQQQQAGPLPALNTGLVVGPRMAAMVANFVRNLNERRVRLVMGICRAV